MHLCVVCNNIAMGVGGVGGWEGRGKGHFTVTCKVLGDNLMGVPTNFGNDCS